MTSGGSKGGLDGCSARTNPARRTGPRIREPRGSGAVQPAVSAWEKPKTIRNNPAQASTLPGQSIPGRTAGRLLRIEAIAPAAPTAANTSVTYSQDLPESE